MITKLWRSNVMRTAYKALPWSALVAFWMPVLGPLIQPGKMTLSHDGVLYLMRVIQLDAAHIRLADRGVYCGRA